MINIFQNNNIIIAKYKNYFRIIGMDYTSRIYESKNDFYYQYLQNLACKQVIDQVILVKYYGIINNSPSYNCLKRSEN